MIAGFKLRREYAVDTHWGWMTHSLSVVWTGSTYELWATLSGYLVDAGTHRWTERIDLGPGYLGQPIPLQLAVVPHMVSSGAGGGYHQDGWEVTAAANGWEFDLPFLPFTQRNSICTLSLYHAEDTQVGDVVDVAFDNLQIETAANAEILTWTTYEPGQPATLPTGRYVQARVNLLADAQGRTTPRLGSLKLARTATADEEAPADVTGLVATPSGGDWDLSWTPSSSGDAAEQVLYLSSDYGRTWDYGVALGAAASSTTVSPGPGATRARITVLDGLLNESAGAIVDLGVDGVAPVVTGSQPADGSRTDTLDDGITVFLSDDASGVDEAASVAGALVVGSVSGTIAGTWDTAIDDQVTFMPSQPPVSQHLTVTLHPTDEAGNSAGPTTLQLDLFRFKDSGLLAMPHTYGVASEDAQGGRSRPTDPVTADVLPPSAPTGVAATATGEDVELSWNVNPEPNVTGYYVLRKPAPDRAPLLVHDGLSEPLRHGWAGVSYDYSYDDARVTLDGIGSTSIGLSTGAPPPWTWEVRYPDLQDHLHSITLHWGNDSVPLEQAARDYTVETWDEASQEWQVQITVTGNQEASPTYLFPGHVSSRRVRLVVSDAQLSLKGPLRDVELYKVVPLTTPGFVETALPLGTNHYVVQAVDTIGNIGAGAEVQVVIGDIASPGNLEGSASGQVVTLSWDHLPAPAPGAIAGYHVYRDGERITAAAPVTVQTFAETLPELGTYSYYVTAVRSGDLHETLPSNTVTVVVDDITYAGVPQGLVGEFRWVDVRLEWQEVSSPDLAGYRVYRADRAEPLHEDLLADPEYVDAELLYRQPDYTYQVTAVDTYGNESAPSEAVTVSVPAPATPTDFTAERLPVRVPITASDLCVPYPHHIVKSDVELGWSVDGYSSYFVFADGDAVVVRPEIIATGAVFTASTVSPAPGDTATLQHHHPATASDNSFETYWMSTPEDPTPTWQAELSREEPVEGLDIEWLAELNRFGVDFRAETWDAATETWIEQAAVTGNSDLVNHLRFADLVYTRKVRLVVTAKAQSYEPVAATEILVRIPKRHGLGLSGCLADPFCAADCGTPCVPDEVPPFIHHALTVGTHIYEVMPENLGFPGALSASHSVWVPEIDLHLADFDVFTIPRKPSVENDVTISTTVRNPSDFDLNDVLVRFYDGDPDAGGMLLGEQTIALLAARDVGVARVVWTPSPADAGTHPLYVVVDPDDALEEWDETNNLGIHELTLHSDPTLDVRVDSVLADSFPEVTIRVRVDDHTGRGLNGLEASNFTVREDGAVQEIVEIVPLVTAEEPLRKVDMVFYGDTSGSMGEEYEDMSFILFTLLRMAELRGIDVEPTLFTIQNPYRWGEPFTLGSFGGVVSEVGHGESWGPMTTYLAGHHPWRDGAVRLLLPISDEYPYQGTDFKACDPIRGLYFPVTTPEDYQTNDEAITACQAHDVTAYPLYGYRDWYWNCSGNRGCQPLAKEFMDPLAAATRGQAFSYWKPYEFLGELAELIETDATNYLVRYRTANVTRDGTSRAVELEVTHHQADGTGTGEYQAPLTEANLSVTPADMELSNLTPLAGEVITVSATVRNLGGATVEDAVVRFFDGHPVAGGLRLGSEQVIPQIAPGEAVTLSESWMALHGDQVLYAQVDPLDLVAETDESDNLAGIALYVPGDPIPELAVHAADVTVSDETPVEGDLVTVSAIVHNVGSDAGSFTVLFAEGTPEDGGPIFRGVVVPSLAGESFVDLEATWVTAGKEGAYELWVVVDPQNHVTEVNEENNRASSTVTVVNKPVTLSITTDRSAYDADELVTITVACNNRLAAPFTGQAEISIVDPTGAETAAVATVDFVDVPTQILPEWLYRVPVTVDMNGVPTGTVKAVADLNFTFLLNELGVTGTFDPGSIRVVEFDAFGEVLSIVAHRFTEVYDYLPQINERGTVEWAVTGASDAAGFKHYQVYFDIVENGVKPDTTTGVSGSHVVTPAVGDPEALSGNSGVVTLTWDTGDTLAGTYAAQGVLSEAGLAIDTRDSPDFVITPEAGLIAEIFTNRTAYFANEWVELRSRLTNASRNLDYTEEMTLSLEIVDPGDVVVYTATYTQALLLRGQTSDHEDTWNTSTSVPGIYTVNLEVSDPSGELASATHTFEILSGSEGGSLTGTLSVTPLQLVVGGLETIDLTVSNVGNQDLTDVEVHAVVVEGATQLELTRYSATYTLLMGEEISATYTLDTAGLSPGAYLVILQAEHSGTVTENLDTGGFQVYPMTRIGLAKAAAATWDAATSSFDVTLTFTVESIGLAALSDVQVSDNLDDCFGAGTYTVTSISSAGLTVNPGYDGSVDVHLLDGSDTMSGGAAATITVECNVTIHGIFVNSAGATATNLGGVAAADDSTAGSDPDPDGDEDPTNDSEPTEIDLRLSGDLWLTKTGPTTVADGSDLSFVLVVRNDGPTSAEGVVLSDPTPAGLSFVAADAPCAGGFPCALGDLTVGDEHTIQVTYAVPAGYTWPDPIINASALAATSADPSAENNVAISATAVGRTAVADLGLDIVGPPSAALGSSVTYQVTVENAGTDDAAGVSVELTPPTGMSLADASVACTGNAICTLGAINAGAAARFEVTFDLPGSYTGDDPVVMTAVVNADTTDPETADNQADASTPLGDDPVDLAVAVSGPARVDPSDHATYELTVSNLGPASATGVTLSSPTPVGLVLTYAETPCGGGFPCTITDLPAGASTTVAVIYQVPAGYADADPFFLTAIVGADQSDRDPTNDTGETVTGVSAVAADLAIAAEAPSAAVAGRPLTYGIVVTNDGPGPASGITLDGLVSGGLTLSSVTTPCVGFPCTLGDLAAGSSLVIHATYDVPSGHPDDISTQLSVSAAVAEPDTTNNQVTVTTPVERVADLSVTKTDGMTAAIPGTSVTYEIAVSNAGPSDAAGVLVSDTVPAILIGASWTCEGTGGATCGASGTGDIADTTNLPAGSTVTYTLTGVVDPAASGTLSNTAALTVPAGVSDPRADDNTASDEDLLTPQADVGIVKSGPDAVVAGRDINFELTVTNHGPSLATGVQVTDATPAGLELTTVSAPCVITVDGDLACDLGDVAAGGEQVLTATYHVPLELPGQQLTNTASASSSTFDPAAANDASSLTFTVEPAPEVDIAVTKAGPVAAIYGDEVVYTVTVTNHDSVTAAPDVRLDDLVPADLVYSHATAPCASGFPCELGELAAGASVAVDVHFTVPVDYSGPETVQNTATVSTPYSIDPDSSNDTAVASTVILPGYPVLGLAKQAVSGWNAASSSFQSVLTFTLTNTGESAAEALQLTDDLDATFGAGNHSVVSLSSAELSVNPGYDGSSESNLLAGTDILATGTSASVELVVHVGSAGAYLNSATASAVDRAGQPLSDASQEGAEADPDADGDPSNNSEPTKIVLRELADLVLRKTGPGSVAAGDDLVSTVTVTNYGPTPARDLVLSDPTPAGLTLVSASAPCAGGFPCALGDLALGQTITLSVTHNVPADYVGPDPIVNTAAISQSVLDPRPESNVAVSATAVDRAALADLGVTLTGPPTAAVGSTITYTVAVTNHGTDDASGVQIDLAVPAELTFAEAEAPCTGGFPCTLATLTAGDMATFDVRYTIPAGYAGADPIASSVSVSATTADPDAGNNQAQTSTPLGADPADLSVSTYGAAQVAAGDQVTYEVVVTNHGPGLALGATLRTSVPAELIFLGATAPCAAGFDCQLGDLAAGSSVVVAATYEVPAGYANADPFAFTATVSATTTDPVAANDQSTSYTGVSAAAADLAVSKRGPAAAVAGRTVTYTLVVTNHGSGTATGVLLEDPTPAGLGQLAVSAPCAGGFPCALDDLAAGSSVVIGVDYEIPASHTDALVNQASVDGDVADPTAANNQSTVTTLLERLADLSVTKTDGLTTAIPGTSVTYEIVVSNAGPSDAPGVLVSDTVPAILTAATWTCEATGGATCTASDAGDIADTANLPAGSTVTYTLTGVVDPAAIGTLSNTAELTVPAGVSDPLADDNTATDEDPLTPQADVEIVKTGPASVVAGSDIPFELTVTNHGPSLATGVQVTDVTPAGLELTAVSAPCGITVDGNLACDLGAVTAGGEQVLTATYHVPLELPGQQLTNTASASSSTFDPAAANDASSLTFTVEPAPEVDIGVTKVGPVVAIYGDEVVYTVTVTNHDSVTAAPDVRLDDLVPADLVYSHATAPCASGFPCELGELAAGASMAIDVHFTVPVDYSGPETVQNTATVSTPYSIDPDSSNDAAVASTLILPGYPILGLAKNAESVWNEAAGSFDVAFVLTLSNTGETSAHDLQLLDDLDAAFGAGAYSILSVAAPDLTLNPGYDGSSDSKLLAGTDTLAAGASVTVSIEVRVAAPGAYLNRARAEALDLADQPWSDDSQSGSDADPDGDADPSNNSEPTEIVLRHDADLVLTQVGPAVVQAGEELISTVTVSNHGPSLATGVVISSPTPAGLTLVSSSAPCGTGFPCSLGELTNDEVVTLEVIYSVPVDYQGSDPILSATAVSQSGRDPRPENNAARTATAVNRAAEADLGVTLSAPPSAAVGSTITYTVTVTNYGSDDAKSVWIDGSVPAELVYAEATAACTVDFQCTLAHLNAGESTTFDVTYAIPAGYTGPDPIASSVSVSASAQDNVPSNNQDQASTPLGLDTADLSASIYGVTRVTAGNRVTYELAVSNAGPGTAENVTLAAPTPAGLFFVEATGPCAGGFACQLGDLTAGARTSVLVSYEVPASYNGADPIAASVSVSADQADAAPENNQVTAYTGVSAAAADLAISQTGPDSAVAGGSVTYTLVVSNHGPGTAGNVTIDDPTPYGLNLVEVTWPCAGGWPCTMGDLAAGSSVAIAVTYAVPSSYTTPAVITHRTSVTSNAADPDLANNSAEVATEVLRIAEVGITKDNFLTAVVPGTTISYTIAATNAGPSDAGVQVADDLPVFLESVTWSCNATGGVSCGTGSGDIYQTINLPAGGAATYTVTGVVNPAAMGLLSNTVTATVLAPVTDPETSNNTAFDSDPLNPTADLVVTKSGPSSVIEGEYVVYTILVSNSGPSLATGVLLSDPTPSGLVYDAASSTCGAAGMEPCSLEDLQPGQQVGITATYWVPWGYEGADPVTNTATVTSPVYDPVPGNNHAEVVTDIIYTTPVIGLAKAAGDVIYDHLAARGESPFEPRARDFSSDQEAKPEEYREYFEDFATQSWRKRPAVGRKDFYHGLLSTSFDVTLTFTVVSLGNQPIDQVQVSDDLAATFAGASYSVTGISSGQLTINPAFDGSSVQQLLAGNDALYPGQSGTITVTVNVSKSGLYSNSASAAADGFDGSAISDLSTAGTNPDPDADGDPGNNSEPTAIYLPAQADLSIVKVAAAGVVKPGGQITYTLTVLNQGPDTASGVTLHDPAPQGLLFSSADAPCETGFPCNLGSIAIGVEKVVNVTYDLPENYPAPSLVFNTATISADTEDPIPDNNDAEALKQVESDIPLWHDVVWSRNGDIVTAYFDGTRYETVVEDPNATLDSPVISPDGNRLALARRTISGTEVCTYDAAGLVCVAAPQLTAGLDWAPDSLTLYFTAGEGAGQLRRVDFGIATPVAEHFLDVGAFRTIGLSVSSDGERLVMAQDPNLITATWIEVYDIPSGTTTTIVPDDGYSDRFPQYSPNRDEIAWARGTDPTCCEAPSDIWIMSGDGSSQLNLTDDPETDNAYPHFSLEGDHVFYLAGSVLQVIDREGIEEPQTLFDLGEVSNFDIASSYPPPLCGEIVDSHDYMGFVPGQCAAAEAVTVTNDTELAAYHSDFGYDPATGLIKNLVVAYNPAGAVEIYSPCQVELVGDNGYLAIDAEHLRVFGKSGVWVAQGQASGNPGITTAGEILLVSEREHARFFQGITLNANRICVQAGKKAELGKDSLVLADGTVALVGTREIGSSDALIDQGSHVIAGRLWLAAYTEAQIAKDAVIEAAEVLIHATGDIGATHAHLRQGVQVWAGEMSMLSENDASIDKNVTVIVEGHFEMEAKGRCRIDRRATIVAGSTSGNCFE